jgi:pyruvate/2-oxoglutarate dehydrogenase complex dihydrolipoamide acyltransferase (E2) component
MTPWRSIATALYTTPRDCRIFGTIDADVTDILEYIKVQREEGNRLTLTHFVAAALARTLDEDVPEINAFVQRGKVILREEVDVFVSVAIERGKDLTGVLVRNSHIMSVEEIGSYLNSKVREKRGGKESGTVGQKESVAKIPWPFRSWIFGFIRWWGFVLGFKVPFINIPRDPFGSIILSNIGTHGLTTGMAALFPIGRVPAVITMGKVEERPVVIDGEIQIRSIMPMAAAMDHRIIDGAQGGTLARGIKRRLKYPEKLNTAPEKTED